MPVSSKPAPNQPEGPAMQHPPLPTRVTRDLARLVESEALGEAFFATAAYLSFSEQERRAWSALRDLEVQTNAGVGSFFERAELPGSAKNRVASAAGFSGSTGLRLVPFSTRLKVIRQGTKRYLPAFQRLAEHAWITLDVELDALSLDPWSGSACEPGGSSVGG